MRIDLPSIELTKEQERIVNEWLKGLGVFPHTPDRALPHLTIIAHKAMQQAILREVERAQRWLTVRRLVEEGEIEYGRGKEL